MLNFFNYYGFFPNWISTFFVIFRKSAVEVTCEISFRFIIKHAKFRFGSSSSMRNFVDVRTIDASRFSHFFVWMESSQFVRRNSQISATSAFISFAQYCTSTCFQSWHSSSKKFKTKHLVNSSARNSRIAAWLRLLKALVSLSKLAAIIGFERLC